MESRSELLIQVIQVFNKQKKKNVFIFTASDLTLDFEFRFRDADSSFKFYFDGLQYEIIVEKTEKINDLAISTNCTSFIVYKWNLLMQISQRKNSLLFYSNTPRLR